MYRILLVGEDFSLLATRAAVLSRIEASTTCCNPSEFFNDLRGGTFDLVILCHSLKDGLGDQAATESRRRWPKVRVMQVIPEFGKTSRTARDVDAVSGAMPHLMLQRISELLNLHPFIRMPELSDQEHHSPEPPGPPSIA